MNEPVQVFVVSKKMGGIIQKAIPNDMDISICSHGEVVSEYKAFIQKNKTHVVILDSRSDESYLGFIEAVNKYSKRAKIIYMFSTDNKEFALEACKLGVKDIFSKPFFEGKLTTKIQDVLR